MPVTLNDCVADLRRQYEKCSDGEALGLCRDALRDLCDDFRIAVVETTIPLVANQRKYLLDEAWDGLDSVAYRPNRSGEEAVELLSEDNADEVYDQGTLWRYAEPDEPTSAFVDGDYLILVPPSAVSSPNVADPFPRLDLVATVNLSPSPSESLPRTIRSTDPIVYRACVKWAADHDREGMAIKQALYDDAIERMERYVRRRNRRQRNQSYPESYFGSVT